MALQLPVELLRPAGLLGLRPCHHQHTLHKHPLPGLSHYDWLYTRALVNIDKSPQNQRPLVRLG